VNVLNNIMIVLQPIYGLTFNYFNAILSY